MSSESMKSVLPEGYKRVQLGPREITLPEEWEIAPVRELFDIEKDSFDPSELEAGSNVMLYSMPAYDSNREPIRTPASEIGSKKYQVPQDTVLFPKLNIRKRRFWRVRHDHSLPSVCSTEYWPLLPKTSLELDFYHYYFDSYEFTSNPKVSSSSSTNSHKRVKQSSFEKLQLPIPPLPEQRRIADILSTVDEQIQQTGEIIEETKELKKGLMQDLLHKGIGHSEFKEMYIGPKRSTLPVDWDVVQLGEIADIQSGSTPKRSNKEYWDNGTIPWIKSGEFNDGVVSTTEEYITEKALEESGCIVFPQGTLLIALYGKGTVSKTARLGIDATTNQAIAGLLPESGDFDPRYLQYYLIDSRNTLLNVTVNPSSDTGRTNIYMSALRQFKVALPPLEEQEKIADRISAVDDKISDEVEYKQHLKDLKRGLMQDLLTGKVRVNTD